MNPLLTVLKESAYVPIPESTQTDKTYWFINNGTLTESENAIVINASDPVTKKCIGGISYVIHNDPVSNKNVKMLSDTYSRHPHIVSIHEWHAAMNSEELNNINWEMCLTPIKVLGNIQKGYK